MAIPPLLALAFGGGGSGGRAGSAAPSGMGLPFTSNIQDTLAQAFRELGTGPNQMDLQAASDLSSRDAALRGVNGPLAVSLGNDARGGVINAWNRQRFDRTMQLTQLAELIKQNEAQRRAQIQQAMQQARDASIASGSGLGNGIGTVAGGGLGLLLTILSGGAAAPAIPLLAGLGGQAGSAIGGGIAGNQTPGSY